MVTNTVPKTLTEQYWPKGLVWFRLIQDENFQSLVAPSEILSAANMIGFAQAGVAD